MQQSTDVCLKVILFALSKQMLNSDTLNNYYFKNLPKVNHRAFTFSMVKQPIHDDLVLIVVFWCCSAYFE